MILPSSKIEASIFDLMTAYVTQRRKEIDRHYDPTRRTEAYQLEEARDHLRDILPELTQWTMLESVAPVPVSEHGPKRPSYLASTLAASLELTKEGALSLQQLGVFEPLYLRQKQSAPEAGHDA